MIILALDTSTRAGSVALMADGELLGWSSGDPAVTHGERLPGELLQLLAAHHQSLATIDLFAVSAGPGSFTGLRVGLATIQGLALAHRRRVATIPTLETLAYAGFWETEHETGRPTTVVPWMDGQRHQVFAAVYEKSAHDRLQLKEPASVESALMLARQWRPVLQGSDALVVGDAVDDARALLVEAIGDHARFSPVMPPLAPTLARLAHRAGEAEATAPHAVRPVYVRRPDAELARDRRRSR